MRLCKNLEKIKEILRKKKRTSKKIIKAEF
jgi:hypothetical protein